MSIRIAAACAALAAAAMLTWPEQVTAAARGDRMAGIEKASFGSLPDGTPVDIYTLTNTHGMVAKITSYGGILTELHTPDRTGKMGDVVLGFDSLDPYVKGHPFFGALVGRVANRIAKGHFVLDGKEYQLAINNGPNALHGGLKGFDKQVWTAEPSDTPNGPSLKLTYVSPDGDQGYPGTLTAVVTYTLTNDNALKIDYHGTSDKDTPINLTNHSYFNLAGVENLNDILPTVMLIEADRYTPTDDTLIPTGELKSVHGTPYDFTKPTALGAHLHELSGDPQGYDVNYVLNSGGKRLSLAARAQDPRSGRVLEVYTTQPGIQLYTSNFLDGTLTGKYGQTYKQYDAFCLETQHFPDSVNHPTFPSSILHPGQVYHQVTVFKFSAK